MQHDFCTSFAPGFQCFFCQKSKKICQFFAIFSRCVSMIYEKVEKNNWSKHLTKSENVVSLQHV